MLVSSSLLLGLLVQKTSWVVRQSRLTPRCSVSQQVVKASTVASGRLQKLWQRSTAVCRKRAVSTISSLVRSLLSLKVARTKLPRTNLRMVRVKSVELLLRSVWIQQPLRVQVVVHQQQTLLVKLRARRLWQRAEAVVVLKVRCRMRLMVRLLGHRVQEPRTLNLLLQMQPQQVQQVTQSSPVNRMMIKGPSVLCVSLTVRSMSRWNSHGVETLRVPRAFLQAPTKWPCVTRRSSGRSTKCRTSQGVRLS
ncbi:hypothetical protein D3C86_1344990 [compost metagenome]